MNLLFGVASEDINNNQYMLIKENIGSLFHAKAQSLESRSGSIKCGFISNNGSILGKSITKDHFLVLLGALEKPLPGWHKGSPIDDPDQTSNYLLNRFLKKGTGFLEGVLGQYVVILCEINSSRLIIGSDPGKFRKVFYSEINDGVIFGTNLISLKGAFKNGFEIDRSLEDFLLGYEFLPLDKTPFKGVNCLPTGTLLEFSDGVVKLNSFTRNDTNGGSTIVKSKILNEKEIIRHLHDTFMYVLDQQSPSTDRVAVLLGGLDSALVASGLRKLGKKVETFSFHFEDPMCNQAHTDRLASFLGIKHSWVHITPEVLQNGLSNYSLRFNQVSSQPHYLIQTAYVCKSIRQKEYLHCFTGDGCDEIFLGYPSVYSRAKLFLRLRVLPKGMVKSLLFLLHWPFMEKYLGHPYRLARNVVTILGRRMPVRGHISSRIFDELSLSRLRLDMPPPQQKGVEHILFELARGLDNLSPLRLAYHGKAAPGLNRNKNEGSSNYSGITIQTPFLHPLMVQAGYGLSEDLLRPRKKTKSYGTGKYILMEMAEKTKLLPHEIIYQRKASPITAPVDRWYMGPLKEFMVSSLIDLPFDYDQEYVADLVQPKLAEELFRKHVSIGRYAFNAISLLVTYASFSKFASYNNF
jgi:hypothetical protein